MPSALPTASELEILRVIWSRGPSTVREVYRTLAADRDIGYSTVLKFMQIMTAKGTLIRDDRVRPQIFRAAQPQEKMQRGILRDLVDRAFGGSAASLVMHALADRQATAGERRQIREMLDELDQTGAKKTKGATKGARARS
jgi:BlaI family penicillinase repressor